MSRSEVVPRPASAPNRTGSHSIPGRVEGRRTLTTRATMTDVAALAGVSHQTVSRVLNNEPHVSRRTRIRVTAAISELGYRPNRTARALVTGHTNILGAVAHTTAPHGPASVLAAFELAATMAGMSVAVTRVADLDQDTLADAIDRHLDNGVAGILLLAPATAARLATDHVPADVPLVAIDGGPDRCDIVAADHVEGARLATRHLLDAGHANVWHVSGPPGWSDSAGRLQGWRAELDTAGIPAPPVIHADWSAAAGYRAGQVLARIPDATAVFAASDHLALGVLRALHESGRTVPRDVSLVGFDDVAEAAHFSPPLTTVRCDLGQLGRHALGLLLARLDDPDRPAERLVVRAHLIQRASVARPGPA